MIPDTPYGRHAVQTLHLFHGLPVESMRRYHPRPVWEPNKRPAWSWGIATYRIQPDALREWMGSCKWLYITAQGGVVVGGFYWERARFEEESVAFWYRDEILDPEPRRGPTYPRLGLPDKAKRDTANESESDS